MALLVAALGLVWVSGAASAHAQLLSTTPMSGASVASEPAAVTLVFGEAVTIDDRSVQVLSPSGVRVDDDSVVHPGGLASAVSVGLRPGLGRASYSVSWRVVSADSHPVDGAFSFGLGVAAGAPEPVATSSPVVATLFSAVRSLSYAGMALLLGGLVFLLALWPGGLRRRRARVVVTCGWGAVAVSAVLALGLQGPYGAGTGLGTLGRSDLLSLTLHERYGQLVLVRLGLLCALLPALLALTPRGGRRGVTAWLAADLAGVVATFSLAEHAGTGLQAPLAALLDGVHVVAASVWLGGLVMLTTAMRPAPPPALLARLLPRWSRLATGCVTALVATGAYATWRDVGSWGALPGTAYGRLLLVKIAVVAVVLVIANRSRKWVVLSVLVPPARSPAPARRRAPLTAQVPTLGGGLAFAAAAPPAHRSSGAGPRSVPPRAVAPRLRMSGRLALGAIRRPVLAELVLGAGVLVLTGVLVNAEPGRTAYTPGVTRHLTAQTGDGRTLPVTVSLPSTKRGAEVVTVETSATAGDLSATMAGMGPVSATLAPAGRGRLRTTLILPDTGTYTLLVAVRTDALTEFVATTDLQIH